MSWRIRWFYLVALLGLHLLLGAVRLARWQIGLRYAYADISWQLENPDFPGPCVAGWPGVPRDIAGGTREIDWPGGYCDSGPIENGQASGVWPMRAPDGSVRRTVTRSRGQDDGPCEFWDSTRTKHVTGSYRRGQRVGIWKLENVLGVGTSYVWFGF